MKSKKNTLLLFTEERFWYNKGVMLKKTLLLRISAFYVAAAMVFSITGCGSRRKQEEYKRAGIEAMQDKNYDKALKCFLNALSQSGSVGREEKDLALYKASAQYKLGKSGEALNTLQGLLEFDSKDTKALYLMGLIYCDCDKPDKAVRNLAKACSLSGKTSMYENAYQSLISAGMQNQADEFYDRMSKEARASKKVLKLRVIGFEEKADYSSALDSAHSYLAQYPDDEEMTKEQDFLKTALQSVSDTADSAQEDSN